MILPNGNELSPLIEPVVVTPDYYVGVEFIAGMAFVHASVFTRWTRGIMRSFQTIRDDLITSHGALYAMSHQPHDDDHAKFRKFVDLMGFTYLRSVRGSDGADHAIFIRRE